MPARRRVVLLLLVLACRSAESQEFMPVAAVRSSNEGGPALLAPDGTSATAVDQMLAAAVTSALVGYALFLAVDNPGGSDRRVKGDAGYTPNANSAYVVGSYIAATITVKWAGHSHEQNGTWIGTAIGGAAVALPLLFLTRDEPLFLPLTLIVLAPLQALASTIGFQVSRRDR